MIFKFITQHTKMTKKKRSKNQKPRRKSIARNPPLSSTMKILSRSSNVPKLPETSTTRQTGSSAVSRARSMSSRTTWTKISAPKRNSRCYKASVSPMKTTNTYTSCVHSTERHKYRNPPLRRPDWELGADGQARSLISTRLCCMIGGSRAGTARRDPRRCESTVVVRIN